MTKYDQHNIINKLRLNLHTSNINIFLQNLSWSKCKYKFNILNVPSFVTPLNLLMHTFRKPIIITNNIALYYKIISCCKNLLHKMWFNCVVSQLKIHVYHIITLQICYKLVMSWNLSMMFLNQSLKMWTIFFNFKTIC